MNADNQDFKYKELTEEIIRIFYRVYNKLGYGFLRKSASCDKKLHLLTLSGNEILMAASTTECHRNKRLPDTERVMKCLSGMKGNFHVPF